ncbi:two-component system sporulation sensor kinase B [Salirhabdus euzebyi]|uniref:histidine kinase n=1 Tax=Salirhabdus euzebyi TaxID=394506 RepID=A0A841Q294_9BACI|nr:HAMP domain-containing sensor histidine kinase [Salirhabdus euzebyi]MBB6452305.1 two-component system sporulation sensor kinase B [Salirhabdus euzebyi]
MGDSINYLLNNVVFVLLPLLFYQLFLREEDVTRRNKTFSKFFFVLVCSLIVTMSFPAPHINDFDYDLHIIPVIITFLYAPILSGISVVLITIAYSTYIDPTGILMNVVNYSIAAILLLLLKRLYNHSSHGRKVLLLSGFYMLLATSRCYYLYLSNNIDQLIFQIYLSTITWITLMFVVYIIENMDKQAKMKRELQNIEKINAVSQIAASVTHEVRNPLTTVRGFLQLLRESNRLQNKEKTYIEIAIDELNRAEYILSEFLSLSKPKQGKYEVIDIAQTIEDISMIMKPYATSTKVAIVTSIDKPLKIYGFKYEVQQVMLNIMKNGIEAMEDGGKLKISASHKEKKVEITITDSGRGMSEKELENIGNPYFSTKPNGTGLGLSVTFEIIKRMGGNVIFRSEQGKGTSFKIIFPTAYQN